MPRLLILAAALALGGVVLLYLGQRWEEQSWEAERTRLSALSQFITMTGGGHVRIATGGEGREGPTVVFDSGLFDVIADWGYILPAVAAFAPVFAFDRPGTGLSDSLPGDSGEKDATRAARDLHAVLTAAGRKPPYVLAGHSLGGLYSLRFAALYPAEVKGLALLEPLHPDEDTRQPPAATEADRQFFRRVERMGFLSRFGIARILQPFQGFGKGLPPAAEAECDALNAAHAHLAGVAAEVSALPAAKAQVRTIKSLGDIPLGILSAGQPADDATAAYQAMHRDMAALSRRGFQEISTGGDHSSIVHDAVQAQDAVALIRTVFDQARGNR